MMFIIAHVRRKSFRQETFDQKKGQAKMLSPPGARFACFFFRYHTKGGVVMKKKVLALLMTGAMAMSLAACGSSSSSSSSSSEAETTSSASEETAASSEEAVASSSASEEVVASSSAATEDVTGAMEGVTIAIGTSGLFGPFSYYDDDGTTLIGYDIDLLTDIQEILGFEIEGGAIQAMDYSALTTSISEGMLDVGAAALCATDERKEVMDFSQIYCDSGQMVMINKNNDQGITSVDDLAGKTVAVEKGTASHIYAQKYLTDSTLEVHDTITTAYESLEQEKVDAVIQDGPGCAFYIKTTEGTNLETVGEEFNQGQAPYCIAYNKDFEYQDEFNAALQMLMDDGTIDELYATWCE